MSRRCTISKKGRQNGHKVSHANNKSKRVTQANLHWKWLFDSEARKWIRIRVTSRTLRTIDRKGLSATLRSAGIKLSALVG